MPIRWRVVLPLLKYRHRHRSYLKYLLHTDMHRVSHAHLRRFSASYINNLKVTCIEKKNSNNKNSNHNNKMQCVIGGCQAGEVSAVHTLGDPSPGSRVRVQGVMGRPGKKAGWFAVNLSC